jgi:Raf kinase inhibitor-like YbhB/YbcL family protein
MLLSYNPLTLEAAMQVESSAFKHGQTIPKKYTCEGENISPPLIFKDLPEDVKTLALIVDDPDAPNGTFDHWITWNLPGNIKGLEENATVLLGGKNSYNDLKYHGPCPPPGKAHRYFFKLYALDTELDLKAGISKLELEKAMKGHIIGKAEFIGMYQRS